MTRIVPSLLVAALVLLAGCAGGIAGPGGSQAQSGDSGTVQFYVSDEQNAIDQFEHLNVTVTKVGFAQSSDATANASADGDVEADSEGGLQVDFVGNVTAGENATVAVTHDGEAVENASVEVDDADVSVETNANGTATVQVPADAEEFEVKASTDEDSEYGETEAELELEFEDEEDTAWVERDVDSRTVDLTELQGANATLLGNVSVPAGEYETVFVHVDGVNGTLESGEEVNVKLPSQKLHLNEDVAVDSTGDIEFVFDITVFEAGDSGKYILKPVASESGTDVPIERVDVESEGDGNIEASFVGDVRAGGNATVEVTQDGEPVENASVEIDDADVTVTTNANGTATVQVPADAEEFEVKASTDEDSDYGETEAELELELGAEDEADGSDESGADDGDRESDAADDDSDDQSGVDAGGDADLAAALDGSLTAGEEATLTVTDGDGDAVEDATIAVDGEVVGETNGDGELTFTVPDDVGMGSQLTVTDDGDSVTIDARTVAAAR